MAQALYRKWRSQTFEEVVGQEAVTQTLQNALREDRVAHAYLFSGPRGTGKTSSARILAKALNCTAPKSDRPCNQCHTCVAITEGRMMDLIEIDAASNNSVDDIRELRDKVGFQPSEGRYKFYIIDEVHMLSNSAFNALLKTLEEPPAHVRFALATTEPHKIPATIISRCQRLDLRRIPVPEIAAHLRYIANEEGFRAEEEALTAIARSAQGCMRDAISLLDQMLSFSTQGEQLVTLLQVQQVLGAVSAQAVSALIDAMANREVGPALTLVQRLLTDGASLAEFCHQVIEQLRGIMVLKMTGNAELLQEYPADTIQQMQVQAQKLTLPLTLFAIKRFSEAIPELKGGYQPQLPLELALIESIQGEAVNRPQMAAEAHHPALQSPTIAPSVPAQPISAVGAATLAPIASNGQTSPAKPNTPQAESADTQISDQSSGQASIEESVNPVAPPLDKAAVDKLRSHWKSFLAIIRERTGIRTQAALNTVRDIAVTEQAVVFAFGKNSFSHNMITKPELLNQVASILSEFLGRSVQLECQMGDKAEPSANLGQVVGTQGEGKVEEDQLLAYAISDLGAEVVK